MVSDEERRLNNVKWQERCPADAFGLPGLKQALSTGINNNSKSWFTRATTPAQWDWHHTMIVASFWSKLELRLFVFVKTLNYTNFVNYADVV